MPFDEAGTQELLERVWPTGRLELTERAADAAQADDIVITIGTPSFSHVESDLRQVARRRRRSAAAAAPRARADPALDDRPRDDRVRRRLPREAARPARRRGRVRRPRARADRRRALPGGDHHAAVHRRRRRRGLDRAGGEPCSAYSARRSSGPRRSRPSWPRSGPTSCATRRSRCPNLLMMDCESYGANVFEVIDLINRDYPAGRDRDARDDRRHVPAQGLRVLRGALQRARECCWPSRGSTRRCRCSWSRASSAGSAAWPRARSRCSG